MVRVRRDLARVARLNSHSFLTDHDDATSVDDPAMLPHVVLVRSPVALKPQTLHNRFLASRHKGFHPTKGRLPPRRMHHVTHVSEDYFANVGATTRSFDPRVWT
jgi:hypothetical protein